MNPLHGRKSSNNPGNNASDDDATAERQNTLKTTNTVKTTRPTSSSVATIKRSNYVVDINMSDPLKRRYRDDKVVGLGEGVRRTMNPTPPELLEGSKKVRYDKYNGDIPLEDDEKYARSKVERRPIVLVIIGYYTALKIFLYYLVSLSSLITVGLSVGMTIYWYERFQNDKTDQLSGTGMDWVLLGFAVITPLSLSIGIAFRRRERALVEIAKFRSFAFQLFLSHCIWDWGLPPDGKAGANIDWVEHADDVLKELISIGDELCRFLTLPTTSRSRHRMTRSGRHEAARTAEVAYRLYESLYTRRFVQLSLLSEKIKLAGLGASEVSRMRQYERFMGDAIENLRMVKTYRTPQMMRSFARLFTTLLPPFFAPQYAQLATNVDSLEIGVTFAVITALCLNALLEGVEILEDPFVAFVTLDGIDVREEFQVLHWQQLVSARNGIFPMAVPYGDHAEFSFASGILGDIESSGPVSDTPIGNASEATHGSRRRRHRALPSLGDAYFLVGLEDEVDKRESGYKLYDTSKKGSDENSSHKATPPKSESTGNKGSEGKERPAS
eukprot:CAMPEP_0196139210 /NCGR_PEP_ID=MMETSP0910-20130528/6572_1 /TAXON_ID=49265 /ORGANISM="Thalassiosira rotula, Strain GSO102" /LENGTH=554 /DNA_ID=CAMNT_0041399911 /DNA_START=94 /DNA_END=1758 /DNA_ORIENTATION=+